MPSITPEEAHAALAQIEETARRMRRALHAASFGAHLALWGGVWILGFTGTYLAPGRSGYLWMVLNALGLGGSAFIELRDRLHPVVQNPQNRVVGRQWLFFWMAVIAYAQIMGWGLPRLHSVDRLLVIILILMLGYVVAGIWTRSPVLSWIGLGVSLAAVLGWRVFAPREFMLWMAFIGGGGLLGPGLYMQFRWR